MTTGHTEYRDRSDMTAAELAEADAEDSPPDAMTPAQVAEAAIHGALRVIQECFNTDGGYASVYFDDSRPDSDWATMQKILTRYAEAEANHE